MNNKQKPESYRKKKLTPEEYYVTREKGTEPAFSGKYWNNHDTGMYECASCGRPLFSSEAKFDSGTGWPSFEEPVNREYIELRSDDSFEMHRTEAICRSCGAHLGHLFTDWPRLGQSSDGQMKVTTCMDYCINSAALQFKPKK